MKPLAALAALVSRVPPAIAASLAAGWYAFVWNLSSGPVDLPVAGVWGSLLANFLHAPVYGLLALLCLLALPRRRGAWAPGFSGTLLAVAVCVACGFVDEWHQYHVPGRDASLPDLATDLCGALGTAWCVRAVLGGASASVVGRRIAASFLACAGCAALATLLPRWRPDLWWL